MSDERSDRQQIERRLRETEERFRVAQAAGGIGWFEWDLGDRRMGMRRRRSPPFSGSIPGSAAPRFADWEPVDFHRRRAETSGRGRAGAGERRFLCRVPGATSGRVHSLDCRQGRSLARSGRRAALAHRRLLRDHRAQAVGGTASGAERDAGGARRAGTGRSPNP